MEEITEERLAKLPKWARYEIERQTRRADGAEEKLAREYPESNTLIDHFDRPSEFLPQDAHVTFRFDSFDEGRGWDNHIRANVRRSSHTDECWLEVYGGKGIVVEPQSSNVVKIKLAPR